MWKTNGFRTALITRRIHIVRDKYVSGKQTLTENPLPFAAFVPLAGSCTGSRGVRRNKEQGSDVHDCGQSTRAFWFHIKIKLKIFLEKKQIFKIKAKKVLQSYLHVE